MAGRTSPLAAALAAAALAGCQSSAPSGAGEAAAAPTKAASPPHTRGSSAPSRFNFGGRLFQGGWLRGSVPAGSRALELDGRPLEIAGDGTFFLAFDRDAPAAVKLTARLANGEAIEQTVRIAPREWPIERIDAPLRPPGKTSAEFQRLRALEIQRIGDARERRTGAQGWRQDFVWPARGKISGLFGAQRIYQGAPGAYHTGVDIAGGPGAPIVAPADGVVILAAEQPFMLEGKLLMIDHGAGLNSAFLHCSELLVREGDKVRQGQPIARIGATGRATGPHLHWSLKWREARLDPVLFAGPMGQAQSSQGSSTQPQPAR